MPGTAGGLQPLSPTPDGNSLCRIFDVRMRLIGNMLIPGWNSSGWYMATNHSVALCADSGTPRVDASSDPFQPRKGANDVWTSPDDDSTHADGGSKEQKFKTFKN